MLGLPSLLLCSRVISEKMAKNVEKPDDNFRYIVRISNTDLDGNKKVIDSIRKIKGVGFSFANAICAVTQVDKYKKIGHAEDSEVKQIEETIKNAATKFPIWLVNRRKDREKTEPRHLVTTDLAFAHENDLRMMKRIRSYRGMRHMTNSPVRGQKTRSNFRRNKGKVLGVAKSKQSGTSGK